MGVGGDLGVLGRGRRGVLGGGLAVAPCGLGGVLGLTLVLDVGDEALLVVGGVGHDLDAAVREVHPVGALEVTVGVLEKNQGSVRVLPGRLSGDPGGTQEGGGGRYFTWVSDLSKLAPL